MNNEKQNITRQDTVDNGVGRQYLLFKNSSSPLRFLTCYLN